MEEIQEFHIKTSIQTAVLGILFGSIAMVVSGTKRRIRLVPAVVESDRIAAFSHWLGIGLDVGNGCILENDNINIGMLPYRVALAILHNLWQILYNQLQRHLRCNFAFWEYQLERLWFVAQLFMLGPYWGRILEDFPQLQPGILQQGSLFPSPPRPTAHVQAQKLAHLSCVGGRMGRNGERRHE